MGDWFRRVGYLLRRRTLEEQLRLEMEAHRGSLEDPRAFGNTLRLREEARDAWGWTWLDDLVQDSRVAWRTLSRSPGFTLTAVLTLALGIGVNIGMFRLVDSLLVRPLYKGQASLVSVFDRSTTADAGYRGFSYPNYLDLQTGTVDVFTELAAVSMSVVGVDAGEGPRRTLVSGVTGNYFSIFRAPLALGRPFTPAEERPGSGSRVAVVSYSLWQQRGADSKVLSSTIRINGELFAVIGVAAEGFVGTAIPGPEVWVPLGAGGTLPMGQTPAGDPLAARDRRDLGVVGRLRPAVARESAAAALATVAHRLEEAFPEVNQGQRFEMATPSRLLFVSGPGSGAMAVVLSAGLMLMPAIVLLVACLNLSDLLLARGLMRRQELAVRFSLGAGRGRIVRQLLTEGLLLALAGSGVGLVLSTWATRALVASLRPVIPIAVSLPDLGLDWRTLAGTVVFSLGATIVLGAWPAWALTGRAAATDLKRQVGEEGRQPGGLRIGKVLVTVQVALSLLLLVTGGLCLLSATAAVTADPGFRLDGGLLAEVDPSLAGYDDARARRTYLALVDKLRGVPGVDAVTIGASFPFSGTADSRRVAPAGAASSGSTGVDSVFNVIGRDYARVLGLPMIAGRDFEDIELMPGASAPVAIVDEALAQRLWPGESALDRQIQFVDAQGPEVGRSMRVVGVIPAVKHSLGNPHSFPHVYVPLGQRDEDAMTLQLRATSEGVEQDLRGGLARIIRDVDENLPVLRVQTWRDHLDDGLDVWLYRAGARVFSAFGAIALLLAVVGVYGVKSYVVSRRTREFGIRIATGAHPRALLWQVLREGSRTTTIGIAVGLLLALAAGQVLQGVLYGVKSVEPVVMITAPLVLMSASLLASYLPARRATKVDPTVALRAE